MIPFTLIAIFLCFFFFWAVDSKDEKYCKINWIILLHAEKEKKINKQKLCLCVSMSIYVTNELKTQFKIIWQHPVELKFYSIEFILYALLCHNSTKISVYSKF